VLLPGYPLQKFVYKTFQIFEEEFHFQLLCKISYGFYVQLCQNKGTIEGMWNNFSDIQKWKEIDYRTYFLKAKGDLRNEKEQIRRLKKGLNLCFFLHSCLCDEVYNVRNLILTRY
jgi:hypothetical protein